MHKKIMNFFWASGIWTLPITLVICHVIINALGISEISKESCVFILIVCMLPVILIATKNRSDYHRFYRDNFTPSGQLAWSKLRLSREKLRALYQYPPTENLYKMPHGMLLAKTRNRYVCSPIDPYNLMMGCIIGTPGSGKSSGPYISTLAWNFAGDKPITCYVIDIKGELHSKCVRADDSRVRIIDTDDPASAGWDPWYDITQNSTDDDVVENLDKCARAIITESNEKNAFFSNSARKIFKGVMLYYFRKMVWTDGNGNVKSGFADAIIELQSADVIQHIKRILGDQEICKSHPQIVALLGGFIDSESEAMTGIKLSLEENLDVFSQEKVHRLLDQRRKNRASPYDLNNRISIFLAVKEDKLESLKPLLRLISYQVLAEMEKRPESSDPVLMVYDEFPRLGKIDRITSALATFRSRKVSMWLAIQDYSQLQTVYGHDMARIILNLCEVCCVLSCRDVETGKLLEEWSGRFDMKRSSQERNVLSGIQSLTENVSSERRSVVELADMMRLRREKGVALWIEGQYCRARRIRWYEDRLLKPIVEENIKFNRQFAKENAVNINATDDYFSAPDQSAEVVFFEDFDFVEDEIPSESTSRYEQFYTGIMSKKEEVNNHDDV